jgi:hypothetical protein
MSKVMMGFIGVIAVLGVLFVSALGIVLTSYNTAVQMETSIVAQYDQNRNNYAKMFNSLKEVAQVPDLYIEGLKTVYDSAIQGRYGKDGAKAMFTWIQEQNPQVDSHLYVKIQSLIEANRNDFESNQKSLIDKKQIYAVYLKQMPRGFILSVMGFPKIDLNHFAIVTSEDTETAFESKKAGPISLK